MSLPASVPSPAHIMSGHLVDDALLTDIISLLHQSRRRALLRLDSSREDIRRYPVSLYFSNGYVAYVSSSNPYHRLGAILIRRGSLTEFRLSKILSNLEGQRLGDALISSGVIDRQELIKALKDQALLTLQYALMRNRNEDNEEDSSPHFDLFSLSDYLESDLPLNLNIDTQGLLLEAFRQQDEVKMLLRRFPPLTECPIATRSPLPSDSSEVAFALQQCAGYTSLHTLLFMNPIGALDALKLYKRLIDESLIEVSQQEANLRQEESSSSPDVTQAAKVDSEENEGWFDLCFTPDVD